MKSDVLSEPYEAEVIQSLRKPPSPHVSTEIYKVSLNMFFPSNHKTVPQIFKSVSPKYFYILFILHFMICVLNAPWKFCIEGPVAIVGACGGC